MHACCPSPSRVPGAQQEWEYAKVRQDAQLERIERGIGTLGDMAKVGVCVGCVRLRSGSAAAWLRAPE